jgi:hypothetical protein
MDFNMYKQLFRARVCYTLTFANSQKRREDFKTQNKCHMSCFLVFNSYIIYKSIFIFY